jgi:hypothetical protein
MLVTVNPRGLIHSMFHVSLLRVVGMTSIPTFPYIKLTSVLIALHGNFPRNMIVHAS